MKKIIVVMFLVITHGCRDYPTGTGRDDIVFRVENKSSVELDSVIIRYRYFVAGSTLIQEHNEVVKSFEQGTIRIKIINAKQLKGITDNRYATDRMFHTVPYGNIQISGKSYSAWWQTSPDNNNFGDENPPSYFEITIKDDTVLVYNPLE